MALFSGGTGIMGAGMRRSRLTQGIKKIKIGNGSSQPNGYSTVRFLLESSQADGAGTLSDARIFAQGAGTIRLLTGTMPASTFTVRAVSSAISIVNGTNIVSINLPVVQNDVLAVWTESGTPNISTMGGFGGNYGYNNSITTLPTVNQGIAITFTTAGILLIGSGYP